MLLLRAAGQAVFAAIAGTLLIVQFIAVYLRVLPYLSATFGCDTAIYKVFRWLGFPLGMLSLDVLMFLEPLGLLPIVPLSERMRQFIPAYKATRIVAEVTLESLPQCLLQSYILVSVMKHVALGTASASEHALLSASVEGATFAEILPRSITISVITMLKTWMDLVHSAREAGISVRTKVMHLWHVGHGLPLDALKKGTISEWACAYRLADNEIMPLLDALIKNTSVRRLNLAEAGIDWGGPDASKQRSGMPLVAAIASSAASLANVRELIVSDSSGYAIPLARLRRKNGEALAALREGRLLRTQGPRRLEILLMADLLRSARRVEAAEEEAARAVIGVLDAARRSELTADGWEARVTELMVGGQMRRAHVKSLLSADVLRSVGFSASMLSGAGFAASELKEGGFSTRALREIGVAPAALQALGYSPAQLKEGGLSAAELHALLGSSAAELHALGFTASELRTAGWEIDALKAAGCDVAVLRAAGFKAVDLRLAGFHALELRNAEVFTAQELRDAGYLLSQVAPKVVRYTRVTREFEELKAEHEERQLRARPDGDVGAAAEGKTETEEESLHQA